MNKDTLEKLHKAVLYIYGYLDNNNAFVKVSLTVKLVEMKVPYYSDLIKTLIEMGLIEKRKMSEYRWVGSKPTKSTSIRLYKKLITKKGYVPKTTFTNPKKEDVPTLFNEPKIVKSKYYSCGNKGMTKEDGKKLQVMFGISQEELMSFLYDLDKLREDHLDKWNENKLPLYHIAKKHIQKHQQAMNTKEIVRVVYKEKEPEFTFFDKPTLKSEPKKKSLLSRLFRWH